MLWTASYWISLIRRLILVSVTARSIAQKKDEAYLRSGGHIATLMHCKMGVVGTKVGVDKKIPVTSKMNTKEDRKCACPDTSIVLIITTYD